MVQFNERTSVAVSRRTVQRKLHFFGYTRRSVRKKIGIITVNKTIRIASCRGLTFEKVDIVEFVLHDTLVKTEVVVFEIQVAADVAADLKRVGLRAS